MGALATPELTGKKGNRGGLAEQREDSRQQTSERARMIDDGAGGSDGGRGGEDGQLPGPVRVVCVNEQIDGRASYAKDEGRGCRLLYFRSKAGMRVELEGGAMATKKEGRKKKQTSEENDDEEDDDDEDGEGGYAGEAEKRCEAISSSSSFQCQCQTQLWKPQVASGAALHCCTLHSGCTGCPV
ncbi:hypothetical protein DM02DRAFT_634817 [Periconia macrospinosa]|uniref:Uncharacterized protein n=1 Tax=Periconia macrospinosa TaxID=97972 RepID=A0A2V1D543_9PLEO|nr:hypothetical protein DM02DRAFT_634817 [Periconia macrospinosa]